jgi:hypothetical protein
VNNYLSSLGRDLVTCSAVVSAYHRMEKRVTNVKMRAQGNSDKDSN